MKRKKQSKKTNTPKKADPYPFLSALAEPYIPTGGLDHIYPTPTFTPYQLLCLDMATLRSPKWERVRNLYIKTHKVCACCGTKEGLIVHHMKPFHLFPELELDPTNFITLCEAPGINCHLLLGHLGNYQSFNIEVATDAEIWKHKIEMRP